MATVDDIYNYLTDAATGLPAILAALDHVAGGQLVDPQSLADFGYDFGQVTDLSLATFLTQMATPFPDDTDPAIDTTTGLYENPDNAGENYPPLLAIWRILKKLETYVLKRAAIPE